MNDPWNELKWTWACRVESASASWTSALQLLLSLDKLLKTFGTENVVARKSDGYEKGALADGAEEIDVDWASVFQGFDIDLGDYVRRKRSAQLTSVT